MAGIGHNNPPPTAELMAQEHAAILKKADDLIEAGEGKNDDGELRLPNEITDAETNKKVINYMGLVQKSIKALNDTRLEATKPLRDEVNSINDLFGNPTKRLERCKQKAAKVSGRFLAEEERKRQEAIRAAEEEAQKAAEEAAEKGEEPPEPEEVAPPPSTAPERTSSGQKVGVDMKWVGTITNLPKLDLLALRQYLPEKVLQEAVNRAVAAGVREIEGVTIAEEAVTRTRGGKR